MSNNLCQLNDDGKLIINDEKIRVKVEKLIVQLSKYSKKKRHDIEKLLGNEVNVTMIMKINQMAGELDNNN